jgi:hypothetical protein
MNVGKLITALLFIVLLQGCETTQHVRFSLNTGDFTFKKTGCDLHSGQYTDKSGSVDYEHEVVSYTIIAVGDDGRTLGKWIANCGIVVPYGTCNCVIDETSPYSTIGIGTECEDFRNFKVRQDYP